MTIKNRNGTNSKTVGKTSSKPQSKSKPLIQPMTLEELDAELIRELIMMTGKDGVGKTSALVSLARYVEEHQPDANFYIIDTENGFKKIWRGFGDERPKNVVYYPCQNMDEVLLSYDQIVKEYQPGDWMSVESMMKVWDLSQNMGYLEIEGLDKSEYLAKRKRTGKGGPIPHPDRFWDVVKTAHDTDFVTDFTHRDDLNVIMFTGVGRPRQERNNRKENADRKDFRREFGIDMNIESAPRLPYVPDTFCMLDREDGRVYCTVHKDRNSVGWDGVTNRFEIQDHGDWAPAFYEIMRGVKLLDNSDQDENDNDTEDEGED